MPVSAVLARQSPRLKRAWKREAVVHLTDRLPRAVPDNTILSAASCNLMGGLAHLLVCAGMPIRGLGMSCLIRRVPEVGGGVTAEEEFVEFAEAAMPRLQRTALLLCGDWHLAEDLVQGSLASVFVTWRRIRRRDAAHAYATRTLVNRYLADRRLKRVGEVLTSRLPDRPAEQPGPELRMLVLDALAALPRQSRAVVVLRYWADLSVEQAAEMLGCSPGNVKSQSARALRKLEAILGQTVREAARPDRLAEHVQDTAGDQHG